MAKKKTKAVKKTTAKKKSSRKEPEMLTLPSIAVHIANEYLKKRKEEIAGTKQGIDWDGGLEDLWRALISVYAGYGEAQLKAFLQQELPAIKKIRSRSLNTPTGFKVLR
jgi:hypothetical protein